MVGAASKTRSPSTFTEGARRAQIVAATIETMAEHGFARTTYVRIAERAGLSSTGLISYHFAGKDDLLLAVLYEIGHHAAARISDAVSSQTSALGRLRARITAQLEWVAAYPQHVRAMYEISMNARDDDGGLRYGESLTAQANVHDLVPLLQAGQESGELRQFDLVLVSLAIKSAVDAAVYRMSSEPAMTPAACADEVAGLFERALRADG